MATATLGNGQSPIDIVGCVQSDAPSPVVSYRTRASGMERTPLPLITFEPGSTVGVGEHSYRLLQVHWHTPAEHTVEGQDFAAELHLVHIGPDNQLLVIGTIYELGEANTVVQQMIDETLHAESAGAVPQLDAAAFTPPTGGYMHYVGSLTAPPFSEPVLWYLSTQIGAVSEAQVEQLQALTNGPNARPLQDLNGRTILCCR
ncbi:MAG: carbonic anhydrase family protein [Chloroflexi bacterium]|nr:carbonic anhydrase family protein [Chloroflexota bacterium]MYD16132.1 carbonic anhydrase family protein [Chloroflexota bacterium]MYJ02384.1 carbonic anhydrase family protein [Chloroflexota bacterium]